MPVRDVAVGVRRKMLHDALDTILELLDVAELAQGSIGFPSDLSRTGHSIGGSTSVENAALHALDRRWDDVALVAGEWLAEAAEAQSQLVRVAALGRRHWPAPPKNGTQVGGVYIGAEPPPPVCAWCNMPAEGSVDDPVVVVNGVRYHRKGLPAGHGLEGRPACYWAHWRAERKGGER